MNTKIIVFLVLSMVVIASATHAKKQKQHHQFKYNSKEFQKVVAHVLSENTKAAPFLNSIKSLIQVKSTGYEKIHSIDNQIGSLHTILLEDQQNDDTQYAADKLRIETDIATELLAIQNLKIRRQALKDKLHALRNERQKIENIYQTDKSAYVSRVAKQDELRRVLDILIEQAQVGLLDNPIVPGLEGTGISQVLAQVKEVGRGRPIEALVQLNKIFTKTDASDIIDRFINLQNAIIESLRIDTEKEDHNLNLYVSLSHNIDDVLIPEALDEIQKINDEIKVHKARIVELQEELVRITNIYTFRKEERANAINFTQQASDELRSELERLAGIGANVE